MRLSCICLSGLLACACSAEDGATDEADGDAVGGAGQQAGGGGVTGGKLGSGGNATGGRLGSGGSAAGGAGTGGSGGGGATGSGGATGGGGASGGATGGTGGRDAAAGGAQGSGGGTTTDASSPVTGTPGVWEHLSLPGLASGDWCASMMVDPVNPGTLVTGCGANDGRKMKWFRTSDFGESWTLVNDTAIGGDPWGASIDPNPNRDPQTPATLYSPAGYGAFGIWKSMDAGTTWTRLTAADSAYAPYNPYGITDLYHTAVLPDDPPNHVLATYHYGFKNNTANEGGFGETWDGGTTWAIHPPPAGVGSSHYVLPISGTTWCVIAQEPDRGMWRTTTAGRTGGTLANKYRDGTISTSAWTRVSQHAHIHGAYTPAKVGNAWYSPGNSPSEGGIWKSTDDGATWTDLVPGYYWPSPPNGAFMNKNATTLAATAKFIYSSANVEIARAPTNADASWLRDYVATPDALKTSGGAGPFGAAATRDPASGQWLVFLATYSGGVFRYVEP